LILSSSSFASTLPLLRFWLSLALPYVYFFGKKSSSSLILMKTCSPHVRKISFDLKSLFHWLLAILVYSLFMCFKRSHQFMNWKSCHISCFFNNNNYVFKFLW
jgi:hypothetical protein